MKAKRQTWTDWAVYNNDGHLWQWADSRATGRTKAKAAGLPLANVIRVKVTTTPIKPQEGW